jgi:hypothetical protein
LLIDLDLQALLSQYLGIPVSELEASVYSVMRGDTDLGRVTRGTEPAEEAANERKEGESPKRGSREGGGGDRRREGTKRFGPKAKGADDPQAGAGRTTGRRPAGADLRAQA